MKSLKLGDVVWVDGYKSKITKITDDGVVGLVLDEGLWTETIYDCNIHDISLDSDGDLVYATDFVPVIGDVVRINEKEYRLVDIDDGVVTLERGGDEIRYHSFYDITWDIMDGYWISSICQQVFSPTGKRKLKVYEVQDGVYLYNSLDELKEIYGLLGEPPIQGFYGTDSCENLIDSLQYGYGLLHYWEDYDSERDFMCRYIKVIDSATLIGE